MRLIICIYLALPALTLSSQNLSVDQIVSKANEAYRYLGDDLKSSVHMDIRDGSGHTIMERELVILRKNTRGQGQKWYAYFKRPADIKDMVFMAWKSGEKDDDRWLYLPALDLVKRVSGSDKRSSFAGSHFAYEDITGRLPQADAHELIATSTTAYRVKSTPKDPASVEFAYFETWIDKKTFLPTEATLYDKGGKAYKSFKMLEYQMIQGLPTQTKFSMTNLQNGESTVVTMRDVRYNLGIPENVFSEAYLRRAPRQYLR